MVKRIAAIGSALTLGIMLGANLHCDSIDFRADERYSIVRENNQPYLVDNFRNTTVPIYDESGQLQCGNSEYRVKGLVNKSYDTITRFLGFDQAF